MKAKTILAFLFLGFALANAQNTLLNEQIILDSIFTLRKADIALPPLGYNLVLSRIAHRAAIANLNRDTIKHTDSQGKTISIRAEEEGFERIAGEICCVGYYPEEETHDLNTLASSLGHEFKTSIRNSPRHYTGIMSKTGVDYRLYGYSLVFKQVDFSGFKFVKYSLTLVIGESEQSKPKQK